MLSNLLKMEISLTNFKRVAIFVSLLVNSTQSTMDITMSTFRRLPPDYLVNNEGWLRYRAKEANTSSSIMCCMECNVPYCHIACYLSGKCFIASNQSPPEMSTSTIDLNQQCWMKIPVAEEVGTGTSIALNKPTNQSGMQFNCDSKWAVDGDRRSELVLKNNTCNCAHTKKGKPNPWWMVNLESEYMVLSFNITNRLLYFNRLHDFEVRVGYSNVIQENALCYFFNDTADAFVFQHCYQPTPGIIVSVQIVRACSYASNCSADETLTMCEIDIYGYSIN